MTAAMNARDDSLFIIDYYMLDNGDGYEAGYLLHIQRFLEGVMNGEYSWSDTMPCDLRDALIGRGYGS